jgi:hypothetical protein
MKIGWQSFALAGVLVFTAAAAGQDAGAEVAAAGVPRLALGTPLLRSALGGEPGEKSWLDRWPDFRLKVDQAEELLRAPFDLEDRLRGVEFRLSTSPVWLGYELPDSGGESRTTLSIQQRF